jgi:hypothetical protein
MRIALWIPLVVACGSDGPTHWNKQPLEPQEGTNEGVTFTIQLPKGMQKSSVESKYSVEWGYHAKVGDEDYVFAPSISVGKASKKQTLDEAIKSEKEPIVWKEDGPNAWAYAYESSSRKGKEDYMVIGQTTAGDVTMRCTARVYPMTKSGKAKDDIPAVARMCASIKPKG